MNEDTERRIDQLQVAADNAAGHVRNLYITFLLFGLYLAITIASTTHEELLRSEPVTLPIINVELPLFGFYWIAPALYVLLHFNLLIQFSLLGRKLHRLDQAIERHIKIASDRAARRDLLGVFAFSHMLIGRHHPVVLRFFLRSMIFISVVLLPIVILLFTQLRFLPYHHVETSWAHRSFVLIDLLLILLLWLKIRYPLDEVRNQPGRWFLHRVPALLGAILVVTCSLTMSVPGDPLSGRFEALIGQDRYSELFDLSVEETNLVMAWPTKEQIAEFGEEIAWRNFGEVISLRFRDLRYASFSKSTFTRADLFGADLHGAILQGANFRGARLTGTNLNGANLIAADLTGANLRQAYLESARFCQTVMPNKTLCNRDCRNTQSEDKSCPWLEARKIR